MPESSSVRDRVGVDVGVELLVPGVLVGLRDTDDALERLLVPLLGVTAFVKIVDEIDFDVWIDVELDALR